MSSVCHSTNRPFAAESLHSVKVVVVECHFSDTPQVKRHIYNSNPPPLIVRSILFLIVGKKFVVVTYVTSPF